MLPAKVLPHNQAAFVAHGGVEHFKEDFEILRQGDFVWYVIELVIESI